MKYHLLPKRYQELADRRSDVRRITTFYEVHGKKPNCVSQMFWWNHTPEGFIFWQQVAKASSPANLPPLPPPESEDIAIQQRREDDAYLDRCDRYSRFKPHVDRR